MIIKTATSGRIWIYPHFLTTLISPSTSPYLIRLLLTHDPDTKCQQSNESTQSSFATFTTRADIDASLAKLNGILCRDANICKKPSNTLVSQPAKMSWWNDELAATRKSMKSSYKKWIEAKNNPASSTANSFCARTTYKKEAARYQRLIRIQKRTSWKSFCSNEMNRDLFTSLHYLAKRSKLTSDAPTRLLVNGITITSPIEIAKAFANHFFKPPIPSSESNNQIVLANDYFLHSAPSTHIPPITYLELESAISTLKQTNSAGTDLLSASFISASYDCYPHILLDILNNALANGWYPILWKTAKIKPLGHLRDLKLVCV